jgi:hypothetical protein
MGGCPPCDPCYRVPSDCRRAPTGGRDNDEDCDLDAGSRWRIDAPPGSRERECRLGDRQPVRPLLSTLYAEYDRVRRILEAVLADAKVTDL